MMMKAFSPQISAPSRFIGSLLKRQRPAGVRPQIWLLIAVALCMPLTAHAQQAAGDDAAGPEAAAKVQDQPADDRVGNTVDEAVDDTADAVQLDPVVVTGAVASPYTVERSAAATRLPITLRETPQSVTVITRERLDDQNLFSLREVLDNTPGVYSYAWDSERVSFTVRGFDVDTLLYDGVPAETNFSTGSIDENIDTAVYERVEIVRGATGLITGAGSPAAAVNLVRKRADSRTLAVQLGLNAGRWDDQRVEADVSTPLTADGSVRARVVGVYQNRESYQNFYSKEKKVFYGVIDADLSPDTMLSIGYDYQEDLPQANTWGSFPLYLSDGSLADWPRSVSTATDWAYWNKRKETAFAELRHDFGNDWSLRSTLTWRRYDEDLQLFYVYGFPDPQTGEGLEPYAYKSDGKVTEKILDVYANGPFSLFGRSHELVVGYSGAQAHIGGREYPNGDLADTGNFFEWDGTYPEPEFLQGIRLQDIDSRQHGLYTAARLSLADPLTLIAGARYGTWKTDYFYIYDAPEAGFHYDYAKLIPYAGLIYDFSDAYSAFASYTHIYKPQNARGVDGAYLDPIDGRSYEIGIKGEHFGGHLDTALTVFETQQDNVAEPVYDPETGEPVYVPGYEGMVQASRAIDGTQTRGFELEVSGTPVTGWNTSLGWTRYLIEDSDGNPVNPYVPRTLIRLFTTWTPAALDRLTVGGGVNWQSKSHTAVGTPDGVTEYRQDAVTLLNLVARYAITPNVSVQLTGRNLLDETYFVLDQYGNLYYGEPINYSVGLDLRF
jgi:outer membrane receptor for ferric coprogen and ferric-rhodotorulic acid